MWVLPLILVKQFIELVPDNTMLLLLFVKEQRVKHTLNLVIVILLDMVLLLELGTVVDNHLFHSSRGQGQTIIHIKPTVFVVMVSMLLVGRL